MAIDRSRRQWLMGLSLAPLAWHARAATPQAPAPRLLTCWVDGQHRARTCHAGRLDLPALAIRLPARGHDVFWHPSGDGSAVVVARRPGRFLVRWQVATGHILARFDIDDTDQEIRLEGHFCFSRDGRRLYATESDVIDGRGQVGVYDAFTLQRVGAWSSGGIGPHSIRLLADGQLAVANGGILNLPETGRLKRNQGQIDPSLAMLDAVDGRLLAQLRLPDPWMSVRHIAQGHRGQLAVALQNEGGPARPLLAFAGVDALRYAEANASERESCGGYAGDVLALPEGLAVSCTTAGRTALWDWDGRFLGSHATPRVCALVRSGKEWIATGDAGDVWRGGAEKTQLAPKHWRKGVALDNHAVPA